jgi:hypothetical protein
MDTLWGCILLFFILWLHLYFMQSKIISRLSKSGEGLTRLNKYWPYLVVYLLFCFDL